MTGGRDYSSPDVRYRAVSPRLLTLVICLIILTSPVAVWAGETVSATPAATCRASRLSWPAAELGTSHLRLEVDVDGDGQADVLEADFSAGSGFSNTEVQLTLTGSGARLEAREEFAFTAITAINQVPKELSDPRHRDALAWIEEALFSTICMSPDPSLAWLLDPTRRLTWIQGSPKLPDTYAIRLPARRVAGLLRSAYVPAEVLGGKIDPDGEVWLFYAGGVHGYAEMVELARKGDRVLLGTAHGVILTNPDRSRHAWIYVYSGELDMKLRFPSIGKALLQGDTAIITLRMSGGRVRVNLNTGAVSK